MSDLQRIIGNRIKSRRHQLGLTLEEIDKRTGIRHGTLSKIERGQINVSAEKLYKISQALDVTVDWLITGSDPQMKIHEAPDTIYNSDDPILVESILKSMKDLPKEDLQLLDTLVRKLLIAEEYMKSEKEDKKE